MGNDCSVETGRRKYLVLQSGDTDTTIAVCGLSEYEKGGIALFILGKTNRIFEQYLEFYGLLPKKDEDSYYFYRETDSGNIKTLFNAITTHNTIEKKYLHIMEKAIEQGRLQD
jgi:hypothetical protein